MIVTAPDSGEGEPKLRGLAAEASPAVRTAAGEWWSAHPAERAVVFVLGIEQALFVEWDIGHGVMAIHRWSAPEGYSHSARVYP